jgi:AcrR family transcriptional regulator
MPRSARRAQLLDAALEVFVAKGYHATGMDDIADRAGVSKPVLYQHFQSKLELYLALLDISCDAVVDAVATALEATDDNKERVAATVDAFYTYVSNDRAAFRLVFESDLTQEPAVRERVERVITYSAALITQVIRDDTGLPDAESELLAVSLVGMAHVSARYWLAPGIDVSQADAVRLVSTLAWRGIRGYPRADGAGD